MIKFFFQKGACSYIALVVIFCISSCSTTRQTTYFEDLKRDTVISAFLDADLEIKILPGDNLAIVARSKSIVEDDFFNAGGGEMSNFSPETSSAKGGFLVSPEGTVELHRLGKIKVAGMTRRALAAYLQQELQPYMKDVLVNVVFLNHKVTVIGAVARPQIITLLSEQISIIDALATSGDISADGRHDDVLLIRQDGDKKIIKHLNLQKHSILSSPLFYMKPNDVLYVMRDTERSEKVAKQNSLRTTLSLVASGLSLIIIILDRVIK